jgi:beta-lactam-binding protein with PASTA domain
MRWRPGPRLILAAVVVIAVGVLAATGRIVAIDSSVVPTSTQASSPTSASSPPVETSVSHGVLVPNAVGKSLAEGRRLMRRADLRGSAIETDPQAPTSRIFGQEPPPGVVVPRGSVVGFRTQRFR